MDFKGLTIEDLGDNNIIFIEDKSEFAGSKIIINGSNNTVRLGKVLQYKNLVLNLKGDNKVISVKAGNKYINNLKIISIRGNSQKVEIGKNFSCGGLEIQMNDGDEVVQIGDDCLFSWGIKMRTSDGHSIIDLETGLPINFPEDISIGTSVWISEDVKVLKGASVPNDCVVGSAAVVSKKFTETNCVVAGVPAKVVRRNIKWDYRQPSKFILKK